MIQLNDHLHLPSTDPGLNDEPKNNKIKVEHISDKDVDYNYCNSCTPLCK